LIGGVGSHRQTSAIVDASVDGDFITNININNVININNKKTTSIPEDK
jgi:hypothetical protein